MPPNVAQDVYSALADLLNQPVVTGCIEDYGFLSVAAALSSFVDQVFNNRRIRNTEVQSFNITLPNNIILKKSIITPSRSITINTTQLNGLSRSWNRAEFLASLGNILIYERNKPRKRSSGSPYQTNRPERDGPVKRSKTQFDSDRNSTMSQAPRRVYPQAILIQDSPEKMRSQRYIPSDDVDMGGVDAEDGEYSTTRKLLDVPTLNALLGRLSRTSLDNGLKRDITDIVKHVQNGIQEGELMRRVGWNDSSFAANPSQVGVFFRARKADLVNIPPEVLKGYCEKLGDITKEFKWDGMDYSQRLAKIVDVIYLEEEEEAIVTGDVQRLKGVVVLCADMAAMLGPEDKKAKQTAENWKKAKFEDVRWLERNIGLLEQNNRLNNTVFGPANL